MIEVRNLTKNFDDTSALKKVNCTVPDNTIYGLVGTNGAGKSTLLRILAGVFKADEGTVTLDGAPIFDNTDAKADIVFVADEMYLPPNWNLNAMGKMFSAAHPGFDEVKFRNLTGTFGLDTEKKLGGFSKGMKRIAAACLALSCPGKVFLFDETFDGMDPAVRAGMKKVIAEELCNRGITVLITSHSLRELEGFADMLAMIHDGQVVLEEDTNVLKTSMMKVHTALMEPIGPEELGGLGLTVEQFRRTGSTVTFITNGDPEEVRSTLAEKEPLFLDLFPLTLEEVFTSKAATLGYDFTWKEDDDDED